MPLTFVAPSGLQALITIGVGAFATAQGITALFAPETGARVFGVPLPSPYPAAAASTPASSAKVHPASTSSSSAASTGAGAAYLGAYGARNIGIGLSMITLLCTGHRAALGVTYAGLAISALGDAYVTHLYGEPGRWVQHAVGSVLGATAAAILLA